MFQSCSCALLTAAVNIPFVVQWIMPIVHNPRVQLKTHGVNLDFIMMLFPIAKVPVALNVETLALASLDEVLSVVDPVVAVVVVPVVVPVVVSLAAR